MRLTTWRWRMSLLGVCALALALALRAGDTSYEGYAFDPVSRGNLRRVMAISAAMDREATAYVHEQLAAALDSLDRVARVPRDLSPSTERGSEAPGVQVLSVGAVGRGAQHAVDSLARREAAALPAHRVPVRIAIVEAPRGISPTMARTGVDAPVGRYIRLPRREGEPCTLLLTVRAVDSLSLGAAIASGSGVLGPCAFVAAFGLPGAALRVHLDSAGWRPAAFARWGDRTTNDEPRRWIWSDLTVDGVHCALRGDAACERGWRDVRDDDLQANQSAATQPEGAVRDLLGPFPWYRVHGSALGIRQRLLLSDLAQELGPQRFGEWWRSGASVDEAYRVAVGTGETAWLSRWLVRSYEPYDPTPMPRRAEVAWWALLVGAGTTLVWRGRRRWIA
ncbi:MAG: hypothetical protein IT359_12190 [Gemmatimonadaceae bacterium]|nr:hypothetical protein [Gemmatimonadaceae bacterium]